MMLRKGWTVAVIFFSLLPASVAGGIDLLQGKLVKLVDREGTLNDRADFKFAKDMSLSGSLPNGACPAASSVTLRTDSQTLGPISLNCSLWYSNSKETARMYRDKALSTPIQQVVLKSAPTGGKMQIKAKGLNYGTSPLHGPIMWAEAELVVNGVTYCGRFQSPPSTVRRNDEVQVLFVGPSTACAAAPTPTATHTPTPELPAPTATETPLPEPTTTETTTATETVVPATDTPTHTATNVVPTSTPAQTATNTAPTDTPTHTATNTVPTNTPTQTATSTVPSNTPTQTATNTVPTNTPTRTATNTVPTNSPTQTATNTVPTNTPTQTATNTPTGFQSCVLESSEDSRVYEASPNTNYGTDTVMYDNGTGGTQNLAFVRFNLAGNCLNTGSPIGPGATIAGADLKLYLVSKSGIPCGDFHELRLVTGAWSETGITWNNKPGASGTVSVTFAAGTTGQQYTIYPPPSDVIGWYSNPSTNYGWRINRVYCADAAPGFGWSTREEAVSSRRPLLTINYIPGSPTNTPTQTATNTVPTSTPTQTATNTVPTSTPTQTATNTVPTNTPTHTATNTVPTNTPTQTATNTVPTSTPTQTATNTLTQTPTNTPCTPLGSFTFTILNDGACTGLNCPTGCDPNSEDSCMRTEPVTGGNCCGTDNNDWHLSGSQGGTITVNAGCPDPTTGLAQLNVVGTRVFGGKKPSSFVSGWACFQVQQDPNYATVTDSWIECGGTDGYQRVDEFYSINSNGSNPAGPPSLSLTTTTSTTQGNAVVRIILKSAETSSDSSNCDTVNWGSVTAIHEVALTTGWTTSQVTNLRQGGTATAVMKNRAFNCANLASGGQGIWSFPLYGLDVAVPVYGTRDFANVVRLEDN